jgi:hypothetical protein
MPEKPGSEKAMSLGFWRGCWSFFVRSGRGRRLSAGGLAIIASEQRADGRYGECEEEEKEDVRERCSV